MYITYQKGKTAELKVELRATEKGYIVSRPSIEARYDLVIDVDGQLYRTQVKYLDSLSTDGNSFELDLRKQTRNIGPRKVYTSDEIDAIAIYVPSREVVLWLTPDIFHNKQSLSFRISPLKRQVKGSRTIDDFIW